MTCKIRRSWYTLCIWLACVCVGGGGRSKGGGENELSYTRMNLDELSYMTLLLHVITETKGILPACNLHLIYVHTSSSTI